MTSRIEPTTVMSTPGSLGATRRNTRMMASDPAPRASAVVFVFPSATPSMKLRNPEMTFAPFVREAEQLRELAHDDRRARCR